MGLGAKWLADMKRDAISEFLNKPLDELKAEIAPILADLSAEHLHSLKNMIAHELMMPHRKALSPGNELIVQTRTGYPHSGIEYHRHPG